MQRLTLFLCAGGAVSLRTGARSGSLSETWNRQLQENGKPSAIQRVLTLLTEMKEQIQTEAKADAEAYDKMSCWCETGEKDKKQAIEDAEVKIADLESQVEGGAAQDAQLSVNVDQIKKEISQKAAALKTATQMREKEAEEFRASETEEVQCITNLKNALQVIQQKNAGLLQLTPEVQASVVSTLQWVSMKHAEMMVGDMDGIASSGIASSSQPGFAAFLQQDGASLTGFEKDIGAALRNALPGNTDVPPEFAARILQKAAKSGASFAQAAPGEAARDAEMFNRKPGGQEAYTSRAGPIIGILKTMKEEFEANLSQAQKDELKSADEFKALKESAEKDIDAMKVRLDQMEGDNSGAIKALSDAKEDLQATRDQRAADVKFLSDLRLQCQSLDRDWAARSKARNTEIKAVSEAISILTSDDARELMNKKFGIAKPAASFLQLQDSSNANVQALARGRAVSILMTAARRLEGHGEPNFDDLLDAWQASESKPHQQLATLAVKVHLDGFGKIKSIMDQMIADLRVQQDEEVKTKTSCKSNFNQNEKEVYKTEQELKDLKEKIESLEDYIAQLTDEISAATSDIANTKIEMKQAGLNRQQENADYQVEISDQRAVQAILAKAIDRMKAVYGFVQESPVSPTQFKAYKQSAGGAPVIGMMEQIVEDSKGLEQKAISTENSAQQAYAVLVTDTAAAINALETSINEKSDGLAQAKAEKEYEEATETSTTGTLEDLLDYKTDLHGQCDFILKNFDLRQKARLEEIEAIQKAKAFLSGMS